MKIFTERFSAWPHIRHASLSVSISNWDPASQSTNTAIRGCREPAFLPAVRPMSRALLSIMPRSNTVRRGGDVQPAINIPPTPPSKVGQARVTQLLTRSRSTHIHAPPHYYSPHLISPLPSFPLHSASRLVSTFIHSFALSSLFLFLLSTHPFRLLLTSNPSLTLKS